MEKLPHHSPDLTNQNIEALLELFPNVSSETQVESGEPRRAIDFDRLRQELSDHLVEGPQERYQLDWPGKRQALLTANAPIAKTLRPVREESEDFDNTKNLFIEGDNLDALKLLQESYLGKVKLIYIDPPYNTGNDFIYEDDFAESTDDYLESSEQVDKEGNRLKANPESNGRFHSDWLSMMYPRLKLARTLLTEDGVITVSIDDNEIDNLRLLMDEVFGPRNFMFSITVLSNPKGRSHDKYVARSHDYLVAYSRSTMPKGSLNVPKSDEELKADFPLSDERGAHRLLELRNTHREFGKHNRPNLFFPLYVSTEDGAVELTPSQGSEEVLPIWQDGFEGCWTWSVKKASAQLHELVGKRVEGQWKIFRKAYAFTEDGTGATKQMKSIWSDRSFHTEKGQAEFNELFNSREKLFQAPKPTSLIRTLLEMSTRKDSVVVDFFAGSGTTAHAVMSQNALDGGQRRWISVQLPETTPEGSPARTAGFPTISCLASERIRRAAHSIQEGETESGSLDTGFRYLSVTSTNFTDVDEKPDELVQDSLLTSASNTKLDRSSEDLLFECLTIWGLDLSLPIFSERVKNHEIVDVDHGALIACFDEEVDPDLVREVAAREPTRAVFNDSSFKTDADRINAEQIFNEISPTTEVKVI